ncbi:alpha/beta hydrolase [Lichenifustis flavocetrariae]|uniref:Alpha/beta hydrolase n=1 Tax=Lichenifustis flavocetrariae TaxID=2949735 RepID=A0AA41Z925_9HYPH|nr:alpha/beta hydrolase [Lichenifustis flavocetrariae]MCW6512565.1 alpha/beta hydrolase [Lichenifustis flavocetrariae]
MRFARLAAAFMLATASHGAAQARPQPVTLQASDGVEVFGDVYAARHPRAFILLFHQAGSSKAEYTTIGPRLAAQGFDALAIDQRSGGSLFGPNATVSHLHGPSTYLAAEKDLLAALVWARPKGLPVILWGSSYSAALVFQVAAEHPEDIAAVLSFSPGEYLGGVDPVAKAAALVRVPLYVTSSADPSEIESARAISDASPSQSKIRYVPRFGVHGSSTLIPSRDPRGAAENWSHVSAFLDGLGFKAH